MSEFYTIEQASDLLGVSKDTIRRRIKQGELLAEKQPGPYGDQWQIPAAQFNQASQDISVVPVTRQVSVAELQQVMQKAIAEAVSSSIKIETAELRSQISQLQQELEERDNRREQQILERHNEIVVEIRARMEAKREEQPKGFWSRLFG